MVCKVCNEPATINYEGEWYCANHRPDDQMQKELAINTDILVNNKLNNTCDISNRFDGIISSWDTIMQKNNTQSKDDLEHD